MRGAAHTADAPRRADVHSSGGGGVGGAGSSSGDGSNLLLSPRSAAFKLGGALAADAAVSRLLLAGRQARFRPGSKVLVVDEAGGPPQPGTVAKQVDGAPGSSRYLVALRCDALSLLGARVIRCCSGLSCRRDEQQHGL